MLHVKPRARTASSDTRGEKPSEKPSEKRARSLPEQSAVMSAEGAPLVLLRAARRRDEG